MPNFSHTSLQISPESDLAFNVRFESQSSGENGEAEEEEAPKSKKIGTQNAVTDLWRIMEKFGEIYEKI